MKPLLMTAATLIASGATNREIAARLGISPRTVESHRESLMKTLALRTVADLTRQNLETLSKMQETVLGALAPKRDK